MGILCWRSISTIVKNHISRSQLRAMDLKQQVRVYATVEQAKMLSCLTTARKWLSKGFRNAEKFKRWGEHYNRAMLRSHQVQQNASKVVRSLQIYNSSTFTALTKQGEEVFTQLPPIVSKPWDWDNGCIKGQYKPRSSYRNTYSSYKPPSRQTYTYRAPVALDTGDGCFAGDSTVQVLNDNKSIVKRVDQVRAGDKVTVRGGFAKVLCVAKIKTSANTKMISFPGGLKITHKHPIMVDDAWCYPKDHGTPAKTGCDFVYNFVLSSGHVLLVNGIGCVTWGNNLKLPIGKEYYSTQIVSDLEKMSGWAKGYVHIEGTMRNQDGSIQGLISSEPNHEEL